MEYLLGHEYSGWRSNRARIAKNAYIVDRADINPYHNVDYGVPWIKNGPYETNLHVTLRKASWPCATLHASSSRMAHS